MGSSRTLITDYIPANMAIPSWSLSIEEHFYLLLPCFFIFSRKTETRVKASLLLIFLALIFRMLTYRTFSISDLFPIESLIRILYSPFHNRMDALSVGVLIAVLQHSRAQNSDGVDSKILRLVSCCLGLLLVGFVYISGALQGGFFYTTIQYSLVCLGFGGLLWGVLGTGENKIQAFLSHHFWVPIARISYSVYLTHIVTLAALSYFFAFKLWMFFFILAFCLLAALPLYLFIEYPCHQFGKKRGTKENEQPQPVLETVRIA
ncbi:MAG: acyltransferase family protein [Gammaproteobacteria bacterium]